MYFFPFQLYILLIGPIGGEGRLYYKIFLLWPSNACKLQFTVQDLTLHGSEDVDVGLMGFDAESKCSYADTSVSEEHTAFSPEDGGDMLLRNVGS
jgi:hypothetical protein